MKLSVSVMKSVGRVAQLLTFKKKNSVSWPFYSSPKVSDSLINTFTVAVDQATILEDTFIYAYSL